MMMLNVTGSLSFGSDEPRPRRRRMQNSLIAESKANRLMP
jgi:hypothetical protein